MNQWFRIFALVLAIAVVGCNESATPPTDDATSATDVNTPLSDGSVPDVLGFPNQPGGNPLVPEFALYPFPSDFYLEEDTDSLTGWHIAIPKEALPGNLEDPDIFSEMDGFSRLPVILAYLPGGIDGTTLPAPEKPELTVADDSPVFLVKAETWERVPVLAENDLTAKEDTDRALILRPLIALEPRTRYVVILRDKLQTPEGKAHQANAAFKALRDETPTTVPAIEKQRDSFKVVNAAIDKLGLDPQEVVLAWSFRTRSEEQVTQKLVDMQTIANTATLEGYTIVSEEMKTEDGRTSKMITATFKAPNFIGPKDLVELDAAGKPILQGTRDASFGMAIPDVVDTPRPVMMYGHGFNGDWSEGMRGQTFRISHEGKFVTVGTNIGFNEDNVLLLIMALSNLSRANVLIDDILQTWVNWTTLARLIREQLADQITVERGGQQIKVIDPAEVHYIGCSNGGTNGATLAATSPQFTRAMLVVGGGGLVHFLERAVQWNEAGILFRILFPYGALDRQAGLSLLQNLLDPVDNINYVHRLVKNRYPGLKPLKALLVMALDDSQVSNILTEWMARTAGVSLITPTAKSIYGLPTVTAPLPDGAPETLMGAMSVYDLKVTPSPPGNLPPAVDNKAHQDVRDLEAYREQVIRFLDDGVMIQSCDGVCDPE